LFALGGIVLIQAPTGAVPRPIDGGTFGGTTDGTTNLQVVGPARTQFAGPALSGHAALSQGAVLAHGTRTVLAEIGLAASETGAVTATRMPVAIAVVLDTSGSMSGEKIEQAKNAVRQLVERMHPEDQVALVTYNHIAQVVQPLTSVSLTRGELDPMIARIYAAGGTVIPDALELGAAQLTTAPGTHVRRVVLVSDGLDGSGRPVDLVSSTLRTRSAEGLTVSALGIGIDYDERFLTAIADAGRGNYEFLARGGELDAFLRREVDEASRTSIDRIVASITLPNGWRLGRVFGSTPSRQAHTVELPVGAMFAGDSRKLVLELLVDAGAPGGLDSMAVDVRYRTVGDSTVHAVAGGQLALASVPTLELADASRDSEVLARTEAVLLESEQQAAVEAWRQGDIRRAQTISQRNVTRLRELQAAAPAAAPALAGQLDAYAADEATFGNVPSGSAEGRAYGLRSNSARRARVLR
jgi:Ca-activated chloride channel family protein